MPVLKKVRSRLAQREPLNAKSAHLAKTAKDVPSALAARARAPGIHARVLEPTARNARLLAKVQAHALSQATPARALERIARSVLSEAMSAAKNVPSALAARARVPGIHARVLEPTAQNARLLVKVQAHAQVLDSNPAVSN